MSEYHIINLEERLKKRRPLEGSPEGMMFEIALMGIAGVNDFLCPGLRGFDLLQKLKPIHPEISSNSVVDTQRTHLLYDDSLSSSFFRQILDHVLILGEEQARFRVYDKQVLEVIQSAGRYVNLLKRSLTKPDIDFILGESPGIPLDELPFLWEKHASGVEKVVPLVDKEFGFRGKRKNPRAGIEIYSIEVGPLRNVRNNIGLVRADYIYESHRSMRKVINMRGGIYGLSSDKLRAKSLGYGPFIFQIQEGSIEFPQIRNSSGQQKDGIKFPTAEEVLQNPYLYLELASRAMMQSTWHNLALAMPNSIPRIDWREAQKHFEYFPHQRLAIIDKIVDAFMVNPKMTFQLCRRLGVFQASEFFSGVDETQLAKILDKLPNRKEHFASVIGNSQEYSAFKILINAMNEIVQQTPKQKMIFPGKDILVFYEDIFPSGKPRGKG